MKCDQGDLVGVYDGNGGAAVAKVLRVVKKPKRATQRLRAALERAVSRLKALSREIIFDGRDFTESHDAVIAACEEVL